MSSGSASGRSSGKTFIAIVLAVRARTTASVPAGLTLAAGTGLVIIGWTRLARTVGGNQWLHLDPAAVLRCEPYVLAALAALLVTAWPLLRGARLDPDQLYYDLRPPLARVGSDS